VSEVWVRQPEVNAVPYRLFITKGAPQVLAAIVFADDMKFYLAYSKVVAGVVKDLILPSKYLDRGSKKFLVFRIGRRLVKTTGYLVVASSKYSLDLLTEEIRYIIQEALGRPVKVRKLKSEEELPTVIKRMSEAEKRIYELAPLDVPSEFGEIGGEEVIIEETPEKARESEES